MKNIHIVSSSTSKKCLSHCLETCNFDDDIVALEAAFNYGAIFKDFSAEQIEKRNDFLNALYPNRSIDISTYFNFDFSSYDKIIVWYGDSVDDIILLSMVCAQFDREIYYIDVNEIFELDKDAYHSKYPHSVCVMRPEQLRVLKDRFKILPKEVKRENEIMWREKWSKSESGLRILDRNRSIIEVDEDYYDELIISLCSDSFTDLARVIGHCLCAYDQFIGDQFLMNRVILLIESGRIVGCNNPKFAEQIAELEASSDKNIYANGLNVTQMRFLMVKSP
ncbi:MAG: DUF3658 domain-containing protein [Rikenellaceae bacterium]